MVAECTDVERSRQLMESRPAGRRSAVGEIRHLQDPTAKTTLSLRLPGELLVLPTRLQAVCRCLWGWATEDTSRNPRLAASPSGPPADKVTIIKISFSSGLL